MRSFSLLFALLLSSICIIAQVPAASISCHFKNVTGGTLTAIVPVNNTVFWASTKELPVSKDGICRVTLEKDQTGYVVIRGIGNPVIAYVQPGEHLTVSIDTAVKKGGIQFTGKNAAGQQLLTEGQVPSSYYDVMGAFRKDSTVALIATHVQQEKEKKLAAFTALYQQKAIDKPFLDFVTLTLNYTYATVCSELMAGKFFPVTYPKAHPAYNPVFPADYAEAWDKLVAQYPVNNQQLTQTPAFEHYAFVYLNGYVYYKKWQKNDTARTTNDDEYARRAIQLVQEAFTGKTLEYAEATKLHFIYIQQRFERVLPQLFADFQKRYPHSAYTPYLATFNNDVVTYIKAAESNFTAEQQVIEDYSNINSFAALKEKLKGKMFYIDMWATWCGPCKAEFVYKDDLHTYMKQKGVTMLYISMDKNDKDQQWKEMIKYYNLTGYHVRTSDSLRNDLMNIFWDGKGYSIPRYVLVDAQGNMVEKNALRPSDKEELYRQIGSHIQ